MLISEGKCSSRLKNNIYRGPEEEPYLAFMRMGKDANVLGTEWAGEKRQW
jgi:hypothetical protein